MKKLNLLLFSIVVFACSQVAEQDATIDTVSEKEAIIKEETDLLAIKVVKFKQLLTANYQTEKTSGTTDLSYQEYVRELGDRYRNLLAARAEFISNPDIQEVDGLTRSKLISQFTESERSRQNIPDWYWDNYPSPPDRLQELTSGL